MVKVPTDRSVGNYMNKIIMNAAHSRLEFSMFSKFSVKKPFTILVAVIIILVLGVVSYMNMTVDLIPSFNLPYAVISTTYVGASPEEVEQKVTGPLEQGMASINNISEVSSVSNENVSMVILKFNEDTNMDTAMIEMREKLDMLESYLPDGAGTPMIMKLNPNMMPILSTAVSVDGMSAEEASQYINDKVIPEIESVGGVASVTSNGLISNMVDVTLSQEKIDQVNADITAHYRTEAEAKIRSAAREEIIKQIDAQLDAQKEAALKQTLTAEMADAALAEPKKQAIQSVNQKFEEQKQAMIAQGMTAEMADAALAEPKKQAIDAVNQKFEEQKQELMKQTVPEDAVNEKIEAARKELYANVDSQVDEIVKSQMDSLSIPEISITTEMISGILSGENFNMPAGSVDNGDGVSYPVRIGDKIASLDELSALTLMEIPNYKTITLADVADVTPYNDADTMYSRVNGNHSVILSLQKQPNYSTAEVSHNVQDRINEITANNGNVKFTTLMDQGEYVDLMIGTIISNLLWGALFAILILFIFLRKIKPTFIVGVSIIISVITAFVLMYFSGITLNMISMSGLALGVGMLVDNSIVVIENIFRYRREGMSAKDAAIHGAKEVSAAIISSTLTTVIVFVPIVFTQGITRQLFTDMALTIAYSLLASLAVALTVVPAACSTMLRKPVVQKRNFIDKMADGYAKLLGKSLKHSWATIVLCVVLLATSVAAAFSSGTELFPEMDTGSITVSVSMPDDYNENDTFKALDELNESLTGIADVDTVGILYTGSSDGMMSMIGSGGTTIYVQLDENKTRSTEDVIQDIRNVTGGKPYEVTVSGGSSDISMLTGGQIVYDVYGKDLDSLREAAKEIGTIIEETEGTTEVDNGLGKANQEIRITVDKEKAIAKGLTVAQVYMTVSEKIAGDKVTTSLTQDGLNYDVYVKDNRVSPVTDADLKDISIETQSGESVALGDIATIGKAEGFTSIQHDGQERYVSVTASLKTGYNTGDVNKAIQEKIDAYTLPEGCRVEVGGEGESIASTFNDLYMMIGLAILFIYLVMVAQFQSLLSPFIVMFTIPLAFTGAFLALFFAGMPVSVVSLIGFVLLVGIVVNNGIVFVDYANQQRKKGMDVTEALVLTGRHRIRPILMTALTTIIALTTMVFDTSSGAELMRPMAVTTIGGLAYSTLLTLFLVPSLYKLFHRKNKIKNEAEEQSAPVPEITDGSNG